MADQKRNTGFNGSQTAESNPYRDAEYQPAPGKWEQKNVREGKEREDVDWQFGKDIVS